MPWMNCRCSRRRTGDHRQGGEQRAGHEHRVVDHELALSEAEPDRQRHLRGSVLTTSGHIRSFHDHSTSSTASATRPGLASGSMIRVKIRQWFGAVELRRLLELARQAEEELAQQEGPEGAEQAGHDERLEGVEPAEAEMISYCGSRKSWPGTIRTDRNSPNSRPRPAELEAGRRRRRPSSRAAAARRAPARASGSCCSEHLAEGERVEDVAVVAPPGRRGADQVGGTVSVSPSVLREVMTSQKNGPTMTTEPRTRTAWTPSVCGATASRRRGEPGRELRHSAPTSSGAGTAGRSARR